MTYVWVCLAAVVGVDAGWQPREGGGTEYIIQIEPEELDRMLDGQEIESDIPNYLKNIRGYRIRVGRGELPRVAGASAPAEPTPAEPEAANEPTPTPAGPPAGEPTLAKPDLSGPALNGPTVRGQNLDEEENDAAASYRDRYGEAPRRLDSNPTAAKPIDDFAEGSFSTTKADPFENRVTPTDYREDLPSSTRGSATRSGSTTSRPSSGGTTRPSRASLEDDPDAAGPSARSGSTATRTSSNALRPSSKSGDEAAAADKPWFAFTMVVLALFASLGGNWYLGWMNWDLRNKYQRALNDRKWRRDDYEPSSRVA